MNQPKEKSSSAAQSDEFGWAIAEGKTAAYPFQLRFRRFPSDYSRSQFPVRLNVFWAMAGPDASGLATPNDIKLMHTFENRIVEATESDGVAVLAMVLTGRGEREFVFFVRSGNDFLQRLTQMPQEEVRYPITIQSGRDPAWEYYDNETRNLQ